MAMARAAKLSAMVGGLVVSTRAKAMTDSAAPRASASATGSAPRVTGRWAVRLTWRSNSRSATSLAQQTALLAGEALQETHDPGSGPSAPPAAALAAFEELVFVWAAALDEAIHDKDQQVEARLRLL